MQVEFILFLTLLWFGKCEKCRQGTTVLTDEYKKVMDQFDFSNFDKQEALNYIDRQRYDNQIRGKRSGLNLEPKNVICHYTNRNIKDVNSRQTLHPRSEKRKKLIKIRNIISRLKRKINEMETYMRQDSNFFKAKNIRYKRGQNSVKRSKKLKNTGNEKTKLTANRETEKENINANGKKKRRHWDYWTEWSPCSVTCGKGRKIRWRRCIARVCNTGELEMEEKTCQLPACNVLSKFLDILN